MQRRGTTSASGTSSWAVLMTRGARTRRRWSSTPTTISSRPTTTTSGKSMTAKTVAAVASVAIALGSAGCMSFLEVPVETPIHAKLDTTSFQRVLVGGFLGGGTKAIDASAETARLLRSQLRSKSTLKVIDADALQLVNEMDKRRTTPAAPAPAGDNSQDEPKDKNEQDP